MTEEPLSGTVIPETPPNNENTTGRKQATSNLSTLLSALSEAISEISSVRTTGTNLTHMANAKASLEQAKTITQNLLDEEEDEKQQTMELMAKDLKDIKKLLTKPTFAQVAATEPPRNPPGTSISQRKSNTANDKIKKQQREKLTVIITAATASNPIKNQLKSMHAKDMIQKLQSAITEQFKEGHIPKIHGIHKLTNDEYRLHCESKEDPQLLNKMNWSLIFNGVKIKKRKYGLCNTWSPQKGSRPNQHRRRSHSKR
jgi:hypothetical protein